MLRKRHLSLAIYLSILLLPLLSSGLALGAPSAANSAADQKLEQFFERAYQEHLDFSPQTKTNLGLKDHYDQLDDLSEQHEVAVYRHWEAKLRELKTFPYQQLSAHNKLSYDLFAYIATLTLEGEPFRRHHYVVDHKDGPHAALPVFMANSHRIATQADAQAYISRLRAFSTYFAQIITRLEAQYELGIIMPRFAYKAVLADIASFTATYPFTSDEAKPNSLWSDFSAKLAKLPGLDAKAASTLQAQAKSALLEQVGPAYQKLAAVLTRHSQKATDDVGVWKHPQGEAFYRHMLRKFTTTDLSPEQIHQLGLAEVARIHAEMQVIQKKLGFKGSLQDFFKHTVTRDASYCPNTEAGRASCLALNRQIIERMQERLPEFVGFPLRSPLEVRRVEAFREKSAAVAFYEPPAEDNSRPGYYYINLYDTRVAPIFKMEALAHHEALPGHHLQISLAQGLKVPKFQRFYRQAAYVEGWGLYAEYFPKEHGFYSDPYSDFGRLSMELWRAARLVVDTGMHAKRWSKDQAFAYLRKETPADESEIVSEGERYIVWPGQATAYKVGMNKILELRKDAQTRLGKQFNIREFHNQILGGGSLPLVLLDKKIAAWLDSKAS